MQLILETFPGIGLMGIGFKEAGFCVVSAGDIILGSHHAIENFHVPKNKFDGVIGGSPCQNFSKLNRKPNFTEGVRLMNEFKRIVIESGCNWWLLENVPESPDLHIDGYQVQRFMLNAKHCGSNQNRNRKFQFGSKSGVFLQIKREQSPSNLQSCVTAQSDERTKQNICELQGLPHDFDLEDFTVQGFKKVVGNGVNVHVSRKLAFAIRDATEGNFARSLTDLKFCICGCGEIVDGKKTHFGASCRKRMQMKRERARVIVPG